MQAQKYARMWLFQGTPKDCLLLEYRTLRGNCLPSDAILQHLPSYLGFSYLGRGVSLHGCSSKAQLLLLTLNEGYLLTTIPPDLERGVAPLGPPAPAQPLLLGRGVAPLHVKSWLIGKDSDAGRDWRQEEKGTTEDETAGWHHQLDGREFVWTPGVGDGQGGLACCDSWGRQSQTQLSDWTELNWTEEGIDKTWSQKGKGHLALSLPPTECCFRVQWSHLYQAPFWFFIFHHREFWAYTE